MKRHHDDDDGDAYENDIVRRNPFKKRRITNNHLDIAKAYGIRESEKSILFCAFIHRIRLGDSIETITQSDHRMALIYLNYHRGLLSYQTQCKQNPLKDEV